MGRTPKPGFNEKAVRERLNELVQNHMKKAIIFNMIETAYEQGKEIGRNESKQQTQP